MKISEVKANLQIIITNLKKLQEYRNNLTQTNPASGATNIAVCRQSVEEAFARIEAEPLDKIAAQLKQRKTERQARRLRNKTKRQKSSSNNQHESPLNNPLHKRKSLTALKKRELGSAKKYLSFMESLETLHQLQGGGDSCNLKESLSRIRSIWQATAQKIESERHNSDSIEAQWDKVLFGESSGMELKCGLKDFIERRTTWDSYLVPENGATGSHIPIGWVCPKEDARPEWKQFRLS